MEIGDYVHESHRLNSPLKVGNIYTMYLAYGVSVVRAVVGTVKSITVHSEYSTSYGILEQGNVFGYHWDRQYCMEAFRIVGATEIKEGERCKKHLMK